MVVENMVSGGSSPSREVQEIMALTNFDKNAQNGNEIMDWPKAPEMPICAVANNNIASKQGQGQGQGQCPTTKGQGQGQPVVQSMELQNAANLIYHSMANNNSNSIMPASSNANDLASIEKRLEDLLGKIDGGDGEMFLLLIFLWSFF